MSTSGVMVLGTIWLRSAYCGLYNIHDGQRLRLTLLDVTVDPNTQTLEMPADDVVQLRRAETVVLVPFDSMGVAVGLRAVVPSRSTSNVVAANLDVSFDAMRAFLERQEIDYRLQLNGVDHAATDVPRVSPHGGLYYRPNRNEPTRILAYADDGEVVRSPFGPDRFRPEGWTYRGTGVILYPDSPTRHVISLGDAKGVFDVPQPVLALRAPPEYLPPEMGSDVEARQMRERATEYVAAALFGVVLVGGIVAGRFIVDRFNPETMETEEV